MTEIADMTPDSAAVAAIGPEMVRGLRELAERATPGPWKWFGNASSNHVYLATTHSGRRYVMDFVRWGMRGAQPRFQPVKRGMVDAKDLLLFEVGDRSVIGVDAAKKDGSVYRYDVRGIDAPDAAYIAAASPDVILAFIERIGALEAERVAEWNKRRDAEASRDVEKAIADTFKAENAGLRCVLEETEEVLALSENTPFPDPAYHDEVKRLGRRIGFGALMSTAERAWREVAEERGHPVGGEFVSGPCRVTLDKLLSQVRAALSRTAIQEPTKVEDGERQGDEG